MIRATAQHFLGVVLNIESCARHPQVPIGILRKTMRALKDTFPHGRWIVSDILVQQPAGKTNNLRDGKTVIPVGFKRRGDVRLRICRSISVSRVPLCNIPVMPP